MNTLWRFLDSEMQRQVVGALPTDDDLLNERAEIESFAKMK